MLSKDQRRKKKLAERATKFHQKEGLSLRLKDKIADTVHEAVCEFTHSDGFRRCAYYAVAGAALLTAVTKKQYLPQCGSLRILIGKDDLGTIAFEMNAELGGVQKREFHSWIGPVLNNTGPIDVANSDIELIDFSTRHYKNYVMNSGESDLRVWDLPDPPKYIWTTFKKKPTWLHVSATQNATSQLLRSLAEFEGLIQLVGEIWMRKLTRRTQ